MTAVVATVRTSAPVTTAWAALVDWVGQSQWMPLTRVDVVSGDGGLGTRLSARTGVGLLAFVDDMVIDVWEPPRRCEVRHLGQVVRGRGIFTVEEADGGTLVSWTEQLEGWPARLAAPLTRAALAVALCRWARQLP